MEIKIESISVKLMGLIITLPVLFMVIIALFASHPESPATTLAKDKGESYVTDVIVDASGFDKEVLKIPAGEDILLRVHNEGATGCANSLVGRDLFEGSISLGEKGNTVETVLHADEPGEYAITCWMGMVSMKVEAV